MGKKQENKQTGDDKQVSALERLKIDIFSD